MLVYVNYSNCWASPFRYSTDQGHIITLQMPCPANLMMHHLTFLLQLSWFWPPHIRFLTLFRKSKLKTRLHLIYLTFIS